MVVQSDATKLLETEESYPKVKNECLLDKYRIPLQHFEYSYVEKCTDGRELEKIVKILRSGEEGYFPDLTKFAENRLSVVKPKSKLLRTECPVLSKENLNKDERNELTNDLTRWISNVSRDEDELVYFKNRKSGTNSFPDVRETEEKVIEENKKMAKRICSTDYSSWDKYDPDTEILKMDLEEENLKKTALKDKKKSTTKKTVQFKDFTTDVEALREANYEKDKGNEFFKTGDYAEALRHYTNSINCKPTLASFNNRALVNIKLKNHKNAMDDCHSALAIEPDNFKALLRKAQALDGLQRHAEALEAVEQAIEVDANNSVAQELAHTFRKQCGVIPKKSTRFVVEEIGEEKRNLKDALTFKSEKKDEVIIPIPGTSKMSPPHYITCSDNPDKVKEHMAKANTQRQIVHLISVDNSDGDDDDCCTVNHLKNICKKENLEDNGTTKVNEKAQHEEALGPKLVFSNELKKEDNVSKVEEIHPEDTIENDRCILNVNKNTEAKGEKTKQYEETCSDNNQLNEIIDVSVSEDSGKNIFQKMEERPVLIPEKKRTRIEIIKEDKCAGGEPYVKDNEGTYEQQDVHSPYTFLKMWTCANNDKTLEQHAAILRNMNMNRIVEVVGCKLDNAMFGTLLRCLCTHFAVPGEVDRLHIILDNIINLPRFGIIQMLMSSEDRNCVNLLVNFLSQHGKPLSQSVINKLLNN